MNKEFLLKSEVFDENKATQDNEGCWRNWSEATEKGWLSFLGHTGVVKKALTGRGRTTFVKQAPRRTRERKEEDKFKHLRNKWSRKALAALRQARRCELYAVRLEMFAKHEATEVHAKLNKDAIRGITKAVEEGCEWQEDLASAISKKTLTNVLTLC